MPDHEPTGRTLASHPVALHRWRRSAVGYLIMVAFWLTGTGCSSIYHRTQKTLPPEPGAQLTLRVEEARRAEEFVVQAGNRLRDDLARRLPAETIQADLDRLQMAALNLQRRTGAARDAAASAEGHPELAAAIERLQLRSQAWLEYVQAARKIDPAGQAPRLDDLLHNPLTGQIKVVRPVAA